MQAEIVVEQKRSALVESRMESGKEEAEARGVALRAILDPVPQCRLAHARRHAGLGPVGNLHFVRF